MLITDIFAENLKVIRPYRLVTLKVLNTKIWVEMEAENYLSESEIYKDHPILGPLTFDNFDRPFLVRP